MRGGDGSGQILLDDDAVIESIVLVKHGARGYVSWLYGAVGPVVDPTRFSLWKPVRSDSRQAQTHLVPVPNNEDTALCTGAHTLPPHV